MSLLLVYLVYFFFITNRWSEVGFLSMWSFEMKIQYFFISCNSNYTTLNLIEKRERSIFCWQKLQSELIWFWTMVFWCFKCPEWGISLDLPSNYKILFTIN